MKEMTMDTPKVTSPGNSGKALLLVGSPKGSKSTSHALGTYLLKKLQAGGMATESMLVGAALHGGGNTARLLETVDSADLVVVSFPLYVDQLPAPLVRAVELIAEHRKAHPSVSPQKLVAVVQCGFPEAHQNQPACDILRQFAGEAGFEWAGALAMGMGGALGGRPLEKAGGMVRKTRQALDLAAESLSRGGLVPDSASALMAKRIIPKWLYLLFGNHGMKGEAKKHGVLKSVYARPYEP
jgi:hypothetical protein